MSALSIGNDIVDFAKRENKHEDRRFRERIFTKKENQTIDEAEDKLAILWAIWASKEAAFKAYQRQHLDCIFSPSAFEIDLDNTIARYHHAIIYLDIQWINETTCQALAIYGGGKDKLSNITITTEKTSTHNDSLAVRQLAISSLDMDKAISIKRPLFEMPDGRLKKAPPSFYLNETPLPIPLSLSHDGDYISMAFLK